MSTIAFLFTVALAKEKATVDCDSVEICFLVNGPPALAGSWQEPTSEKDLKRERSYLLFKANPITFHLTPVGL